jgi:hypothetical protein
VAVLVLGVTGALLLAIAEFSTIASVDVAQRSCEAINDSDPALADRCVLSGFERHGGALLLLALLAAAMALGAGPGRSRPASVALVVVGLVVLAVGLLVDLPETRSEGLVNSFDSYSDASGSTGSGFYLELAGGALLVAAGALGLSRRAEPPQPRGSRRREERQATPPPSA